MSDNGPSHNGQRDESDESDGEKFRPKKQRDQHNKLQKIRRGIIADSFVALKESVPYLEGKKRPTRADILEKSAEYINNMKKEEKGRETIEEIERGNKELEKEIARLEKLQAGGSYTIEDLNISGIDVDINLDDSEVEPQSTNRPRLQAKRRLKR